MNLPMRLVAASSRCASSAALLPHRALMAENAHSTFQAQRVRVLCDPPLVADTMQLARGHRPRERYAFHFLVSVLSQIDARIDPFRYRKSKLYLAS
jgi:hypothetical protein